MRTGWPTSILTGTVAIAVVMLSFSVDIGASLTRLEIPKFVSVFYVVWGLLMLWGTAARYRLAWRATRIVAGVSATLSVLWPVGCIGATVVGKPPPFWVFALAVSVSTVYYTIWCSFDRPSAMKYFRLLCPRCGLLTNKGVDLLLRRAKCNSCGEVWK